MIDLKNNYTEISLPRKRAIYFLYSKEEMVYIGSTDNILVRIAHHIYDKRNRESRFFDSYSYTLLECSNEEMKSIEAEMILTKKPKWNRILHSNPSYKSFDWFARTYFNGRVREFKNLLMDKNIEPAHTFKGTNYYTIEYLCKVLEDHNAKKVIGFLDKRDKL